MVWGPVVARLTRMERRIAAVENARANAIAFFEPKDLVKLLKDDEETETSIARSTELTAEEIIAQAEEFRRRPGSGSILDPLRQKKE